MENGINIDPNVLIQVLNNKLAQAAVREAEMEAAIQGLMAQVKELTYQVEQTHEPEDSRASANE